MTIRGNILAPVRVQWKAADVSDTSVRWLSMAAFINGALRTITTLGIEPELQEDLFTLLGVALFRASMSEEK